MKRYLLTGLVVLFVGLEASNNPFDLKQNLKHIDEDQNALLLELKKVSIEDEVIVKEEPEAKGADIDTINNVVEHSPVEIKKEAQAVKKPEKETSGNSVLKDTMQEAQVQADTKEMKTATNEIVLDLKSKEDNTSSGSNILEITMKDAETQAKQKQKLELEKKHQAIKKYDEKRLKETTQVNEKSVNVVKVEYIEAKEEMPLEIKQTKVSKLDMEAKENISKSEIDRLYLEAIKEVEGK